MDEKDDTAIHVLATLNQKPVGCLRILVHDDKVVIGRVAVLKPFRRNHIINSCPSNCLTFCCGISIPITSR